MDHVVYLDAQAKELEKLLSGEKSMLIRGAAGRKMPHGRVHAGDILYFINNNGEGKVQARGSVIHTFHSEKLTEVESQVLISDNLPKLRLTEKQLQRWSGKRFLVLVEVNQVESISPFEIDKSGYGNMDDWLPVDTINSVKM